MSTSGLFHSSQKNVFNDISPNPMAGEQETRETADAVWSLEDEMMGLEPINWNSSWESWLNADTAAT
jgi:hypothetical protein